MDITFIKWGIIYPLHLKMRTLASLEEAVKLNPERYAATADQALVSLQCDIHLQRSIKRELRESSRKLSCNENQLV